MAPLSPKTRSTKQRKLILDVVKAACYHPTAEQVFTLVKKSLPKVSVGTVYRNLDVLAEQKLIKKIDIPGQPARFDADSGNKAYFVCKRKGAIYDLHIDPKKLKNLISECECIDEINDLNILLFGTSKDCPNDRGMRKGIIKK